MEAAAWTEALTAEAEAVAGGNEHCGADGVACVEALEECILPL
jgi:hypothetical protein